MIKEFLIRFPATVELALAAMLFAIGRHPARALGRPPPADPAGRLGHRRLALGVSIPVFVLGLSLA